LRLRRSDQPHPWTRPPAALPPLLPRNGDHDTRPNIFDTLLSRFFFAPQHFFARGRMGGPHRTCRPRLCPPLEPLLTAQRRRASSVRAPSERRRAERGRPLSAEPVSRARRCGARVAGRLRPHPPPAPPGCACPCLVCMLMIPCTYHSHSLLFCAPVRAFCCCGGRCCDSGARAPHRTCIGWAARAALAHITPPSVPGTAGGLVSGTPRTAVASPLFALDRPHQVGGS
jgi:hypothetical protein